MTVHAQPKLSVTIVGHHLVARIPTAGLATALFSIDISRPPSFFMKQGQLICRDNWGPEFPIEVDGASAQDLLEQIVQALQERNKQRRKWRRGVAVVGLALAAVAGSYNLGTYMDGSTASSIASIVSGAAPEASPPPHQTQESSQGSVDGGWTLASDVRKQLPVNLGKAAERQLFTVEYSKGHPRTIYVFADPSCPNCQRLEPALEAASREFNVIVFPVSIIGKEKSVADASAVLCLQPEQRKAAWSVLYDPGADALSIGQQEAQDNREVPDCTNATKALAINDVAYRTYQIPGTPWAIADDGRYVSQAQIRDLAKLKIFMASEVSADGAK